MRGSHGLSARRARRTKSRGPKGLQLEVGARRAPRLLVHSYLFKLSKTFINQTISILIYLKLEGAELTVSLSTISLQALKSLTRVDRKSLVKAQPILTPLNPPRNVQVNFSVCDPGLHFCGSISLMLILLHCSRLLQGAQ